MSLCVFIPQQASSDMKIRKRRRVLKARTFVDEEGCIGMLSIQMIDNASHLLPDYAKIHVESTSWLLAASEQQSPAV